MTKIFQSFNRGEEGGRNGKTAGEGRLLACDRPLEGASLSSLEQAPRRRDSMKAKPLQERDPPRPRPAHFPPAAAARVSGRS